MNKIYAFLTFTFFLLFMTLKSMAFYNPDGDKFPPRILCDDTSSSQLNIEICADSYTLNGETYNYDGIYTQIFTNAAGCDSTVYLILTLKADKPVININELFLSTTYYYMTYQWYKNDTAIAGATNRLLTLLSALPACYSVVVNEAFCPDTSDYYCIEEGVKVVKQILQNQVEIYPNPTFEILNISAPIPVNTEIFSLEGRIWQRNQDTKKLSLENLPQGIYFIRITDVKGNLIKVERIVKK